jgi:hypothetical protein
VRGLRSEKIKKVDIAGFLKYLKASREHPECSHLAGGAFVVGRAKGRDGQEASHGDLGLRDGEQTGAGEWADQMSELL